MVVQTGKRAQLDGLYRQYAEHPLNQHIVSWEDACFLYDLVAERKPKKLIELGTGIGASTAAITLALPDGSPSGVPLGSIYPWDCLETVEHILPIQQEAIRLLPMDLRRKAIFILATTKVVEYHGMRWNVYDYKPLDTGYDFVFIDGPPHDGGVVPGGDLFSLLPYLAKDAAVVVDGRNYAVRFYEGALGGLFSYTKLHPALTLMEYRGG